METTKHKSAWIIILFFLFGLLLSSNNLAQDEPCTQLSKTAGTRSSPFNPPTDDVFVTDDGPGLDTGCTFNTDPEHPLIIDIYIDRYVGEVDANGFLVDPDPLIAKGIIPASIDIIMPAFDVDFNGTAPPERDEVFFNGVNVGFLNGDNQIWLLNSFTVEIGKVKFPKKPFFGGTPTPVANRVQINVDLLATGRWCTAIDWVALVIPIRTKIALTLTVKGGNKVREISDDVIYKQSFDNDCNVVTEIGPFKDFPFSGSIDNEVTLRTKIEYCPPGGPKPEVKAYWTINGPAPSLQTKGTSTWTEFQGDVKLKMPERVNISSANIDYEIDGQTISVSRLLYVTFDKPKRTTDCWWYIFCPPPKRAWYDLATNWAGGINGAKTETETIRKVRQSMYSNPLGWKYLDNYSSNRWMGLVESTADDGNCVVFSDVLKNMSAVLGVDVGDEDRVSPGTFVTKSKLSLDRNFAMAGPHPSGARDRYVFGMHSLLKKGSSTYHDATFDGEYGTRTEFINWFITAPPKYEKHDNYTWIKTNEGALIRDTHIPLPTPYGDSWGNDLRYIAPTVTSPMFIASTSKSPGDESIDNPLSTNLSIQGTNANFTGNVTYVLKDDNLDGFAEALVANVEVEILVAGTFLINGSLLKNGNLISIRTSWNSMSTNIGKTISANPGLHTIQIQFSGEEIFQSDQNGPYELHLDLLTEQELEDQFQHTTPAFNRNQFGELPAAILSSTDQGQDIDGDGKFDLLHASFTISVRIPGDYLLDGTLWKDDKTIAVTMAPAQQTLGGGTHVLKLDFDGKTLRRSGMNGPYILHLSLAEANTQNIVDETFNTQNYNFEDFELAFLDPDGSFNDQGIDTNSNGLFDILRINFGANIEDTGTYLVSGELKVPAGEFVAFTDMEMTLAAGSQVITLDFIGPVICKQEIDGPYKIEVVVRNPNTFDELDRVLLGKVTMAYDYTDFDPFDWAEIMITGNSNDYGIDSNNNGRFDELHVEVEVALAKSDFYEWSARLVDVNNTVIDFDSRNASFNAGKSTINFIFDGEKIGQNGIDGPYFVKGLLMFGQTGPNAVYTDVAVTQHYAFTEFEGSIVPMDTFDIATATISFLKDAKDAFSMTGYFKLGNGSDGFDLNTDEVEVKFGTYKETIPAGAFTDSTYSGSPGAITYMKIKKLIDGSYIFGIKAREVDMDSTLIHVNPDSVPVNLQIGDDLGDTKIKMIAGKSSWKYMANLYKQDSKGLFEGFMVPDGFELKQNRPNPFNPSTTISFTLHEPGNVILSIYNTNGKLVRKLFAGSLSEGSHDFIWDGLDKNGARVASGLYLYRLETSDFVAQKKLLFVK